MRNCVASGRCSHREGRYAHLPSPPPANDPRDRSKASPPGPFLVRSRAGPIAGLMGRKKRCAACVDTASSPLGRNRTCEPETPLSLPADAPGSRRECFRAGMSQRLRSFFPEAVTSVFESGLNSRPSRWIRRPPAAPPLSRQTHRLWPLLRCGSRRHPDGTSSCSPVGKTGEGFVTPPKLMSGPQSFDFTEKGTVGLGQGGGFRCLSRIAGQVGVEACRVLAASRVAFTLSKNRKTAHSHE